MKTSRPMSIFSLLLLLLIVGESQEAQRCGSQYGGSLCPEGQCCSVDGYCGASEIYCCERYSCQSQCSCPLSTLILDYIFDQMLLQRNHEACQARGFYTYEAFIEAAKFFPQFAQTGNETTRRREIAAFLAQTSHQTTGGWQDAPGGPYAWGYCILAANGSATSFCIEDDKWPCVPGKKYYGRGPFQLSYNVNYGRAGEALGLDLLSNPDLVEIDPVIAFKTAIWFWMTEQHNKPSCHSIMVGEWEPSAEEDIEAGRIPGFGVTTNVLNGLDECGNGVDSRGEDRIGFYQRFRSILRMGNDINVDCYQHQPFDKDWSSHLKLPTSERTSSI